MEDREAAEEDPRSDHMTSHLTNHTVPNNSACTEEKNDIEATIPLKEGNCSASDEDKDDDDHDDDDDHEYEDDNSYDDEGKVGQQHPFVYKDQVICFLDDNEDGNDDEDNDDDNSDDNTDDPLLNNVKVCPCVRDYRKLAASNDAVFENDLKFLSDTISTLHDISCYVDNVTTSKDFLPEKNVPTDEDQGCIFNMLPREIIVKIFSYLTNYELCFHVLPVCRTWYVIGYDPGLWQELDFIRCPSLPTIDLCRTIKRACNIKKLRLVGRHEDIMSEPEVALFTPFLKNLRKVDLGFCDGLTRRMLESFITNCSHLQNLNVEGCQQVDDKAIEVIARKTDWKVLNFSHCNITDTGVQLLAETLTSLEYLNIDGISWIQDSTIRILVDYHGEHIRQLELDGAELTDSSLQHIAQCRQLTTLMISFCDNLTDRSLRLLQGTKSLTRLMLRKGANFSSGALISLFQSPALQNLTKLNLSECIGIVDETVFAIVKCCGSKLKELSLCWCWHVTDIGLIAIVDHCRMLSCLDLDGMKMITGACFKDIPKCMAKLTYLNLRDCNMVIDSVIEEVVRQKKDLTVYNYYGEKFIHT